VIKVHPADSVAAFQRLALDLDPRGEIAVLGGCDLGALLSQASLLICQRSNIVVDAALLGTPTMVCRFAGESGVIDFVAEGLALSCPAAAEIRTLVRRYVFDLEARAAGLAAVAGSLHRFNGANDGGSARRIAAFLQRAAGLPRAAPETSPSGWKPRREGSLLEGAEQAAGAGVEDTPPEPCGDLSQAGILP
jgi:hypothetical protein